MLVKISPKRRTTPPEAEDREPAFLWWMPLVGIVLAAGWATWGALNGSEDGLVTFAERLVWPGVVIFAVTTFAVWLAWKVEFE